MQNWGGITTYTGGHAGAEFGSLDDLMVMAEGALVYEQGVTEFGMLDDLVVNKHIPPCIMLVVARATGSNLGLSHQWEFPSSLSLCWQ